MSLDIRVTAKKENVYAVELNGSLDSTTYLSLETELKKIITPETRAVIIDMADVNYISSAGIGVTMWAQKELKKTGGTFSLINLQPHVERIFEIMKILPFVSIFRDMPEADKYIDQAIQNELERRKV